MSRLLAERGIDWLFANGGTDFAPMVEGLAAAEAKGRDAAAQGGLGRA